MPFPSKYEKQDVINQIIKMRTEQSKGSKSVLEYLMNELGYSQAQSYVYMRQANEQIKEIFQHEHIGRVESTLSELETVAEWARKTNNTKLWLEIKKEINKITGVYAPEKMEIKTTEIELNFGGDPKPQDESEEQVND